MFGITVGNTDCIIVTLLCIYISMRIPPYVVKQFNQLILSHFKISNISKVSCITFDYSRL
jgi:hypothetical protein